MFSFLLPFHYGLCICGHLWMYVRVCVYTIGRICNKFMEVSLAAFNLLKATRHVKASLCKVGSKCLSERPALFLAKLSCLLKCKQIVRKKILHKRSHNNATYLDSQWIILASWGQMSCSGNSNAIADNSHTPRQGSCNGVSHQNNLSTRTQIRRRNSVQN